MFAALAAAALPRAGRGLLGASLPCLGSAVRHMSGGSTDLKAVVAAAIPEQQVR